MNGNGNGNGNFFQESPSSSNKTEAYVIPISLAVTDFHFLVLANIQFFRNNQKGKEKEKGVGKGNYKDKKGDNRNKGKERGRGIFSGKSNIFLLAFSRLDGTLSQSIELRTEIPTNRFQISEGLQQQQQSQQHRIMTESRKKNSSDSATTLSSSSAVENDRNDCFAIVNEPTKLYRRVGACVPQSISSCCSFLLEAEEVVVEVAVTAELLIEMSNNYLYSVAHTHQLVSITL